MDMNYSICSFEGLLEDPKRLKYSVGFTRKIAVTEIRKKDFQIVMFVSFDLVAPQIYGGTTSLHITHLLSDTVPVYTSCTEIRHEKLMNGQIHMSESK